MGNKDLTIHDDNRDAYDDLMVSTKAKADGLNFANCCLYRVENGHQTNEDMTFLRQLLLAGDRQAEP